MSRVDFHQVCKRYGAGPPLTVKDATLGVAEGEFCVFLGPSGCGKSTLLRMVAGLEDISSGDLSIAGVRVNDLPPARRGVAMVFQNYALYPHMTVAQNMAFGLQVMGSDRATIAAKVRAAAETLQLTPLLDRLPKSLSGGQRQRVAIGRAIVRQPRVFLFDEPLSNLDAALRVQTRLEIARLHHELRSSSMIYVTHDQVEAMTLADKIVLLHAGPLVEQRGSVAQIGTPMTLYHRPASTFVAGFIGSPTMNFLPGRLLRADGSHAQVDVAGRVVTAAVDARALPEGAAVQLGVRPEQLRLADQGEGSSLTGRLRHVERLGDSSLLYVDVGPGLPTLTVKVEGSADRAVGTQLTLHLLPGQLHLFDDAGQACDRTVELPT